MVAGKKACTCATCAVVCKGRFGGCPEVWAAGPRTLGSPVVKVALTAAPVAAEAASGPDALSEQVASALASIRHDVEGVHLDLNGTIIGLKEIRDAVDELARTTAANVDGLRGELAGVTQLLARQQAALDKLLEAQSTVIGARTSYEKLVEERRLRMAAAAADESGSAGLRGLFPRIQRSLHNGHTDAEPPIPAPDPPEADWHRP
ncbi:MAG: hypothetical protein QOG43_3317 [Actinomycetota bacterium]|jgi:hypothetical protein|nr:hypothetical protein [Actinomycetota bacterium]